MAQSRNAPGTGAVPDPGGPFFPVNTATTVGIGNATARATPAVPSTGVSRPGATLPLNTPTTQSAPLLGGGSPQPAIQPVSGVGRWPVVGTVSDPGAARFPVGVQQTIGMPADTATPGGGDPSALGSYVPGTVQNGPAWSQANISGNPNPGALSGGGLAGAPAIFPGQTGVNQVSPEANPNPGGL